MRFMLVLVQVIFLISILIINVHAASFDCNNAKTLQEKQICQDPQLGQLDDDLAQEWKATHKLLTENVLLQDHKKALSQFQLSWLNTRDQCQDKDCLLLHYQQQLERLRYLTQFTGQAIPEPVTLLQSTACFHGVFGYEQVLNNLTEQEYAQLSGYSKEMYDQKAPYLMVSLVFSNSQNTMIKGELFTAWRYGNKLDDGEFSAWKMNNEQATGEWEGSFGGRARILLTCLGESELLITRFAHTGEGYLFSILMQRNDSAQIQ